MAYECSRLHRRELQVQVYTMEKGTKDECKIENRDDSEVNRKYAATGG